MTMRLFLDTEWADNLGSELVSLALVTEDGKYRFYAEVNPLPANPTDFVRNVVYPLLEGGHYALRHEDLTRQLRQWLAQFRDPFVLYDYAVDGSLFRYALDGFESQAELGPCPQVNQTLMLRDDLKPLIERYFRDHPEMNPRRHHAGVDADALRWAFAEALKASP